MVYIPYYGFRAMFVVAVHVVVGFVIDILFLFCRGGQSGDGKLQGGEGVSRGIGGRWWGVKSYRNTLKKKKERERDASVWWLLVFSARE